MVIQAQLNRRRQSRDQRSDIRRKMRLVAAGKTIAGQSGDVLIHDLSTSGLLVQTDVPLTIGEDIEVVLPRTGARQVEVVWKSGTYFGCRFLQPVPPAAVSAALLLSMPERTAPANDQPEAATPADFGARLTVLRVGKGWSLETLAERLGVSRQAVWYWETGQRLPRAEHFERIAEVFEVQQQELIQPAPRTVSASQSGLVEELKREVARRNGVTEDKVKIVVEF
jgi:transcriptional regulator with XRE-family HTH domain